MTHSPAQTAREDPPPLQPHLPTMYDLPSENPEDSGLPDYFHFLQPLLLYLTFQPANWNPELVYSAMDLNLYYDPNHHGWYKRPDWFGVVGEGKLYQGRDLRMSYVAWQEEVNPRVVVELISPGTEKEDLGETVRRANKPPTKWEVYEQILGIPYYFVYNRYTEEMRAFQLVEGRYESMESINGSWLLPDLGLSLALWKGEFEGVSKLWLRWFTLSGEMIPIAREELETAAEEINRVQEEAALARQEAAQSRQRAEKLAARLRELGIDPDELS